MLFANYKKFYTFAHGLYFSYREKSESSHKRVEEAK